MRPKTLQKQLDKIYESDGADFGGQYLWCKECPHCGTVPHIELPFCKATKEQRTAECLCATAYTNWKKGVA